MNRFILPGLRGGGAFILPYIILAPSYRSDLHMTLLCPLFFHTPNSPPLGKTALATEYITYESIKALLVLHWSFFLSSAARVRRQFTYDCCQICSVSLNMCMARKVLSSSALNYSLVFIFMHVQPHEIMHVVVKGSPKHQ